MSKTADYTHLPRYMETFCDDEAARAMEFSMLSDHVTWNCPCYMETRMSFTWNCPCYMETRIDMFF